MDDLARVYNAKICPALEFTHANANAKRWPTVDFVQKWRFVYIKSDAHGQINQAMKNLSFQDTERHWHTWLKTKKISECSGEQQGTHGEIKYWCCPWWNIDDQYLKDASTETNRLCSRIYIGDLWTEIVERRNALTHWFNMLRYIWVSALCDGWWRN